MPATPYGTAVYSGEDQWNELVGVASPPPPPAPAPAGGGYGGSSVADPTNPYAAPPPEAAPAPAPAPTEAAAYYDPGQDTQGQQIQPQAIASTGGASESTYAPTATPPVETEAQSAYAPAPAAAVPVTSETYRPPAESAYYQDPAPAQQGSAPIVPGVSESSYQGTGYDREPSNYGGSSVAGRPSYSTGPNLSSGYGGSSAPHGGPSYQTRPGPPGGGPSPTSGREAGEFSGPNLTRGPSGYGGSSVPATPAYASTPYVPSGYGGSSADGAGYGTGPNFPATTLGGDPSHSSEWWRTMYPGGAMPHPTMQDYLLPPDPNDYWSPGAALSAQGPLRPPGPQLAPAEGSVRGAAGELQGGLAGAAPPMTSSLSPDILTGPGALNPDTINLTRPPTGAVVRSRVGPGDFLPGPGGWLLDTMGLGDSMFKNAPQADRFAPGPINPNILPATTEAAYYDPTKSTDAARGIDYSEIKDAAARAELNNFAPSGSEYTSQLPGSDTAAYYAQTSGGVPMDRPTDYGAPTGEFAAGWPTPDEIGQWFLERGYPEGYVPPVHTLSPNNQAGLEEQAARAQPPPVYTGQQVFPGQDRFTTIKNAVGGGAQGAVDPFQQNSNDPYIFGVNINDIGPALNSLAGTRGEDVGQFMQQDVPWRGPIENAIQKISDYYQPSTATPTTPTSNGYGGSSVAGGPGYTTGPNTAPSTGPGGVDWDFMTDTLPYPTADGLGAFFDAIGGKGDGGGTQATTSTATGGGAKPPTLRPDGSTIPTGEADPILHGAPTASMGTMPVTVHLGINEKNEVYDKGSVLVPQDAYRTAANRNEAVVTLNQVEWDAIVASGAIRGPLGADTEALKALGADLIGKSAIIPLDWAAGNVEGVPAQAGGATGSVTPGTTGSPVPGGGTVPSRDLVATGGTASGNVGTSGGTTTTTTTDTGGGGGTSGSTATDTSGSGRYYDSGSGGGGGYSGGGGGYAEPGYGGGGGGGASMWDNPIFARFMQNVEMSNPSFAATLREMMMGRGGSRRSSSGSRSMSRRSGRFGRRSRKTSTRGSMRAGSTSRGSTAEPSAASPGTTTSSRNSSQTSPPPPSGTRSTETASSGNKKTRTVR